MAKNQCKICRRAGEKLFLKGDKCYSPKCPLLRKPAPPGMTPKKRKGGLSEYGKELKEAQKLKKMYAISDRQFKKIIKEVLAKKGKEDVSMVLMKKIEKMLSNVVFKAQLAKSRASAKQLISHGHFLLNGRKVTVPSIEVKVGDEIRLKDRSKKNSYFQTVIPLIKKENIPSWLSFDKEKIVIKVVQEPNIDEIGIKINVPLILSFYSR
ncbi:MAG TPA: 30S ribosomal protein S4 [Candidatus Pacearchaeota archaeon]|nr:30S ribosomal protein S4 [Candidatus Pacearchaeota archaeon]HOK94262.1 30S ribosomal protein S4 [Candidatus Pacearchaeota archaeon]HPO75376.1 30S ribosomal protein S4 [Candidatus Pacearchaeota archaeon]